uniref:Uncharacterized protein n=1 Tax=viral metagenome TaxID=1070528 RepID=A0A6M3KA25_9ZZZZ
MLFCVTNAQARIAFFEKLFSTKFPWIDPDGIVGKFKDMQQTMKDLSPVENYALRQDLAYLIRDGRAAYEKTYMWKLISLYYRESKDNVCALHGCDCKNLILVVHHKLPGQIGEEIFHLEELDAYLFCVCSNGHGEIEGEVRRQKKLTEMYNAIRK